MTPANLFYCHKNATHSTILWIILTLLATPVQSIFAQDLTRLAELRFSADIITTLPGTTGDIHSTNAAIVAFNTAAGTATSANDLGALDPATIDAFHQGGEGCGDSLYSLDITTMIGRNAMRPADIFTAIGSKFLDANLAGIPAGVNIDAVSREPGNCDLLLSIDTTAMLGLTAYKPDDVIRWNKKAGFSLYQRTNLKVNIDALHVLGPNHMLISIDAGSSLPDLASLDDMVLEISAGRGGYQLLAFEPAKLNDSWQGADLNALWALPAPFVELIFRDSFE